MPCSSVGVLKIENSTRSTLRMCKLKYFCENYSILILVQCLTLSLSSIKVQTNKTVESFKRFSYLNATRTLRANIIIYNSYSRAPRRVLSRRALSVPTYFVVIARGTAKAINKRKHVRRVQILNRSITNAPEVQTLNKIQM